MERSARNVKDSRQCFAFSLVTVLDQSSSKAYSKENTGYEDIDGSVLAGFLQTGK
jgi:hypothetical protein